MFGTGGIRIAHRAWNHGQCRSREHGHWRTSTLVTSGPCCSSLFYHSVCCVVLRALASYSCVACHNNSFLVRCRMAFYLVIDASVSRINIVYLFETFAVCCLRQYIEEYCLRISSFHLLFVFNNKYSKTKLTQTWAMGDCG